MAYTIFDTIKDLTEKGLTFQEAIKECESKLRTKLPEEMLDIIVTDWNYRDSVCRGKK